MVDVAVGDGVIIVTYSNYQSRLKWFKNRWMSYQNLLKFSSGFRFDPNTKKFTTPDEVLRDANLRYGEFPDYEDLAITVGNGVAVGKNSIGLGSATDANTLGDDENRDARIEDLMFDAESEAFVALSQDEPLPSGSTPPSGLPEVPVLNTIAPDMMVKPSTATPAKIQESTRFMPFFKDFIGAIDGTHISVMVPGREVSSFRNRHGMQSQNILTACNFDLQFIYVLSGWEGSAHDSKLLNDTLSRRNGLQVPQGKYFLVDCRFANRRQFLSPLCGVRYHLKDFGGQGCHPRNASELFNLRHASLRNVIERIFGVFKSRFTIFKTAPPFSFQTQAELVLACAGLHNFLQKECRSDEFLVEYEGDQDLPPLDMEEENVEWLSQSQLQQRTEANAWRMSIANAMWESRPMYNDDGNKDDETQGGNDE
ncbi:nuclease HARBI1-like protein [Perilla frutescens var. hirtella]|uniref:Nuclease HARBI1-like protein n=1 Tax=Perilla frutescens var. hirtella TaxID=608512 RepID=A0AAD4JRL8_PERFH|nr:nuclease HARBI1-like protein [Perilla frutescens var. hirtella]